MPLVRKRKGMALAMTAVMLPLVVVIMAFAIDVALAQTAQSRLESAVHQAADLGARRLPDEEGAAQTARAAGNLALSDMSVFGDNLVLEIDTDPTSLQVVATLEARSYFGRFVGRDDYRLAAQARRTIEFLSEIE